MLTDLLALNAKFILNKLFIVFIFYFNSEINCYDGFREGYFNEYLPGSTYNANASSRPNIPLITDTNRYGDGVTSTAYFGVNSPSFPQNLIEDVQLGSQTYNSINPVTLPYVSERVNNYKSYMENAENQGLAAYLQGDAQRETARLNYLKKVAQLPQFPPAPTKTFPVYAAVKWNPSDFAIQDNEEYLITAEPQEGAEYTAQTWTDGGLRVDADGYKSYYDAMSNCYVALGRCRSHLKKRKRHLTADWMQLVCSVGEFVRPVQEVYPGFEEESRFLPIDESRVQITQFTVGKKTKFTAKNSGQLICFANDAHTLYWNNAGKINVTITRLTWPPSSENYYTDLSLPACDSAYAVYKNKGNWSTAMGCNPNGGGSGWVRDDVLK